MTRITILVEDSAHEPLLHEHGLSMLVEAGNHRILFDTGHSDAFAQNARLLDLDLDPLDAVVVSHPHYDHAGGLCHLRTQAPLFVSDGFFVPRYRARDGENIGAPCTESEIRERFDLHTVAETTALQKSRAVIITGFEQPHPLEREPSPFAFDPDGLHPDTFSDELMLAVPARSGYVVLGGCCHAGVIGMLERCCQVLDAPITHFIGGLHLLHASEDRVRATAVAMGGCHLRSVWVGHCTGEVATAMLQELVEIPVHRMHPGLVVEV